MSDLAGRSAIVTGGLSGIGRAIAEALAGAGVRVHAASRRGPAPMTRAPGRSGLLEGRLDVCDLSSIDAFLASLGEQAGAIDILVNAAGITAEQPVTGHPDALWQQILDTNLTGAFRMIRATLPAMMERGWGRIINIGSTAATAAHPDNPAYCASKAGLLGLTRAVALEAAPHGVTCVMISPTWVRTPLMDRDVAEIVARDGSGRSVSQAIADIAAENPQGRILDPEEIAALAVFLCSDAARGITGEEIRVTGGATW